MGAFYGWKNTHHKTSSEFIGNKHHQFVSILNPYAAKVKD